MLAVCFVAEPRAWLQDQWSWVFSNFGVTQLYERNKGGGARIYQRSQPVATAAELPADLALVVVTPRTGRYLAGQVNLVEFDHPSRAVYLFGATHGNLTPDDLGGRCADALVYVPTAEKATEMFPHAAAYLTLYDRLTKRGDFG